MPRDEAAGDLHKLWAVLSQGPGHSLATAHCDRRVEGETGEDRLPESRVERIADDDRDEPGVDHLQQILVLQILRDRDQLHRRFAHLDQSLAQRFEMFPVAGGAADVYRPPGEILHAGDARPARASDHQLARLLSHRRREIDQLLAFRGDGQVRGGDVPLSVEQGWDQLIARHGDEHHLKAERLSLELGIDLVLEASSRLTGWWRERSTSTRMCAAPDFAGALYA